MWPHSSYLQRVLYIIFFGKMGKGREGGLWDSTTAHKDSKVFVACEEQLDGRQPLPVGDAEQVGVEVVQILWLVTAEKK